MPNQRIYFIASTVFVMLSCAVPDQRVSVAKIKISFASTPRPPSTDLSKEAHYPPGFDSIEHGAFTNIVDGRITRLHVTWAEPKIFKTKIETEIFLKQLLSATNSQTWEFHIWSYADETPCVVATAQHLNGKQGQWFVWCSPSLTWAYLDGNGKWWWSIWPQKVPWPASIRPP